MNAPLATGPVPMTSGDINVRATTQWAPDSWQQRKALQQPRYEDGAELAAATAHLAQLPPLVTSWEVLALKQAIGEAQDGERFLLQGGDCAESFADCTSPIISNRLKVLLQMSLVLVHGLKKPVLRVGRFAGQYAKPRSTDTETRDGLSLPSFRGDVVNSPDFTPQAISMFAPPPSGHPIPGNSGRHYSSLDTKMVPNSPPRLLIWRSCRRWSPRGRFWH